MPEDERGLDRAEMVWAWEVDLALPEQATRGGYAVCGAGRAVREVPDVSMYEGAADDVAGRVTIRFGSTRYQPITARRGVRFQTSSCLRCHADG